MGLQKAIRLFRKKLVSLLRPIHLHVAQDTGGRDKPTVVLLHGIAASSSTWESFVEHLDTDKFRVVALDLLGFGESPKPLDADYTAKEQTAYIHKAIQRLQVRSPYILIGHSLGSLVAAHYAYTYPREVKVAYLLSMPLYLKNNNARIRTGLYMKMYEYLRSHQKFTIRNAQWIRKLLASDEVLNISQENWHAFTKSIKSNVEQQNTAFEIESTNIPFCVIYGKLDEFIIKKDIDSLAKFGNVEIVKVPKTAHILTDNYAKHVAGMVNVG